MMMLETGYVLDSRYRIEQRLAQDQAGAVYRAYDIRLQRTVAIRQDMSAALESPEAAERLRLHQQFKRQAAEWTRLGRADLCVFDHFITPDGGQYLVLEFVEGEDWAQALTRIRALTAAQAGASSEPAGASTGKAGRIGPFLLAGLGLWVAILAILLAVRPSSNVRRVRPTSFIVHASATPVLPPTHTPAPTPTEVEVKVTPMPLPVCASIGLTWTRPSDIAGMVCVPAGEFLMGSTASDPDAYADEMPQHAVFLDAFWIDKTEVTTRQYNRCVRTGVCTPASYAHDARYAGGDLPVVGVTWQDAQTYCQWAGAALPTEAQWEKAVRGPSASPEDSRIYPWGNQLATCEYAVMNDGHGDGCGQGTIPGPVGSKPKGASPYGALDMAGNLWEWTADWYDQGYYAVSPSRNPSGPAGGTYRVARGGSLTNIASGVRAASRDLNLPGSWGREVGFRCARDAAPE